MFVDQTTDQKGRWLRQGSVGKSALLAWKDSLHAREMHQREWVGARGGGAVPGAWGWDVGWRDGCISTLLVFSASSYHISFGLFFLGFLGRHFFLVGSSLCVFCLSCHRGMALHAWGLDGLGRKRGKNPTHTTGGFGLAFWQDIHCSIFNKKKIPVSISALVPAWMLYVGCRSPLVFGAPRTPLFFSIGGDSAVFRRQRMPPLTVMVDRYGSTARGPFWNPRMQGTL